MVAGRPAPGSTEPLKRRAWVGAVASVSGTPAASLSELPIPVRILQVPADDQRVLEASGSPDGHTGADERSKPDREERDQTHLHPATVVESGHDGRDDEGEGETDQEPEAVDVRRTQAEDRNHGQRRPEESESQGPRRPLIRAAPQRPHHAGAGQQEDDQVNPGPGIVAPPALLRGGREDGDQ